MSSGPTESVVYFWGAKITRPMKTVGTAILQHFYILSYFFKKFYLPGFLNTYFKENLWHEGRGKDMFVDALILFQIAGIGIIVALIHTILKQMGKEEIAQFATLIGFILVLLIVVNGLSDLFQQIRSVFLF